MDCLAEREDCYIVTVVSMMDTFQKEFLMEKVALSVRKVGIMKVSLPRNRPKAMEHLSLKKAATVTKGNGQAIILMGLAARSGQKGAR